MNKIARSPTKIVRGAFLAVCCLVLLVACGNNMRDESRLKPYEPSSVFADTQAIRPIDPNTVARTQGSDLRLTTGKENNAVVTEFPVSITRDVLVRGQKEYTVYCVPCHGAAADGQGVLRGYFNPPPANLTDDQERAEPVGHFFDVITNGFGIMYSYAGRVTPEDRWAIIAYIRALQLNKDAPLDVPPDQVQAAGGAAQ
jgi:mono/diheme cytochrome c family protein